MQPSGARSGAVRYRAAGLPKKLTLGSYPTIDLAAARKRALEALGDVAARPPSNKRPGPRQGPSERRGFVAIAETVQRVLLRLEGTPSR
jgi:hypothetical protein